MSMPSAVPNPSVYDTPERRSVMRTQDLAVSFGGVQAVKEVTLAFEPGKITGVIGPNGAGKSTMLAALSGQVRPTRGRIYLLEQDVTRKPPFVRARQGLARTFQTTSEFAGLTVFENLLVAGMSETGGRFWRSMAFSRHEAESKAAQRAWEVLERFEMTRLANSYGRELSGGQRRLVEVMRCLMQDPRVILLDEPMVGVASHLVKRLVGELRRIASEGVGLVVVEHALEVVDQLCDRVVVMAFGQVIADGSYEEVIRDHAVQRAYIS
jgi:branched-chain amino acid transport system permease protein